MKQSFFFPVLGDKFLFNKVNTDGDFVRFAFIRFYTRDDGKGDIGDEDGGEE